MYILDTDSMEALKIQPGAQARRIPEKTIQLAEELDRLESLIASKDRNGNGELILKLKVVGGKLTRFFQLSGKWFPWG